MDVAALDLGSNSFHLLVARTSSAGLTKLASQKRVLRIGAAGRRIPAPLFDRAVDAIVELVEHARDFPDARVVAVGTHALREAENGAELARTASQRARVAIEILSGDAEARLVCEGARSGLASLPSRVAVVDIGGGSVEIAISDGTACHAIASLPLGFLRFGLAPAHGDQIPPCDAEALVRDAARHAVERARTFAPEAWIFSGGTARAFRSVAVRLGVSGGRELGASAVRFVADELGRANAARMAALGVEPPRAQSLGAGAAVLASFSAMLGAPAIVVSSGGLREGVVLREARRATIDLRRCRDGEARSQLSGS